MTTVRASLAFVVLACALAGGACGKKKDGGGAGGDNKAAEAAELERWMNKDFGVGLACFMDAKIGLTTLTDDDFREDVRGELEDKLGRRLMTRLDSALADAKLVKPPAGNETVHQQVIEVATAYRAITQEMLAAVQAGNGEAYKQARAKLADVDRRFDQFNDAVSKQMNKLAVDVIVPDLPKLPERKPPKQAFGCDGAPCPCAPGTEVKTGDTVTACTLAKLVEIRHLTIECDAKPVTFYSDGRLKTCVASRDMMAGVSVKPGTEVTLFPTGELLSGTFAGALAGDGFSCGPGPIEFDVDHNVTGCVLAAALTWGDATIPAKSAIMMTSTEDGSVIDYAVLPDGKELCFDHSREPVIPCKKP